MISSLFNTTLYQPLYNGLIFLIDVLPFVDAGVAVVIFTCIVKFILFPLSKKAVITQFRMKQVAPELEKIKEQNKGNSQEQAMQTMALYKKNGISPFVSIILVFIQLPIIFALYFVFLKSGWPQVNTDLLYSFIKIPASVDVNFLGLIDISGKSWILAIAAAVTNFFQMRYSMPPMEAKKKDHVPSFKDDLARSMQVQMKYVFPVVILFIAYNISGAIAIYWTTSNLFALGQELVIRRHIKKNEK